jgi:hypothetical protein
MDTLSDLCQRTIARERAPEPTDCSMITVEPVDFRGKESEFLGVVILDGHRRSDAHNGRSTMFRVEAGEHIVSVHIKRRFRVPGYRGRAEVSRAVVVEPGGVVNLVFGIGRSGTISQMDARAWWNALAFVVPLVLPFAASVLLAFALGWVAFPVLRDAVGWSTLKLGIRQPWLSWFHFLVSSRMNTAVLVYACALTAWLSLGKRSPSFPHQIGSPYFLEPRRPGSDSPLPFKKQYVDPFE